MRRFPYHRLGTLAAIAAVTVAALGATTACGDDGRCSPSRPKEVVDHTSLADLLAPNRNGSTVPG